MTADAAPAMVRQAFEAVMLLLPLDALVPLRPVSAKVRRSAKYTQIAATIAEDGLAEPPIVARHATQSGRYLLLDGHLRVDILRDTGVTEVSCLVATDDEAFTYNKRISRLAAVQEHRMILNAIARKVPEERLARVLNIDMATLRIRKRALVGICPETVEVLKDKPVPLSAFALLRRMLPIRQIEAAELMVSMNRYSRTYVQALLAATPAAQLVPTAKPKTVKGLSQEQMALMERETAQLDREIRVAEQSYGSDHLRLVLARGYVGRIVGNVRIARWLSEHQPEMLAELQHIVEANSAAA